MAAPVTTLHQRLRAAGIAEPQADVIVAVFEALDRRLRRIEPLARVQLLLLGITFVAVVALCAWMLFEPGGGAEG